MLILFSALKANAPGPAHTSTLYIYSQALPFHDLQTLVYHVATFSLASLLVLEISLGVLLIARWRPRLVLGVAIGALVVFSIALGALILDKSAPSCGCSGALRLADDARTENTIALGRNLLLIAACVWLRRHAHGANSPARRQDPLLDSP